MNRKLIIGMAVGVFAGILIFYAASPFLAAKALGDAAERGDQEALERLVDFPKLRDSMKSEFNDRLVGEMRRGGEDPLGGLGAFLGPAIISGAVDALVTPQAVAAMVRSGEAPRPRDAAAEAKTDEPEPKRTLGYRGLNTFAIGFQDADRPQDRAVTLLMKRHGLFAWKLEAIDLPEAADQR